MIGNTQKGKIFKTTFERKNVPKAILVKGGAGKDMEKKRAKNGSYFWREVMHSVEIPILSCSANEGEEIAYKIERKVDQHKIKWSQALTRKAPLMGTNKILSSCMGHLW